MHAATIARRTSFGDFSPGSGRVQCRCIARSTGERCRCDAVQGVTACRSHGGLAGAVTTAKRRDPTFKRAASDTATRRMVGAIARAAIAAGEPTDPEGGLMQLGRRLACLKI